MVSQEIVRLLRQIPFNGLRVHLSDGTSYEVRHPDMMLVTKTMVVIAIPVGGEDVAERTVYCDPIHVVRVEPLPTSISA